MFTETVAKRSMIAVDDLETDLESVDGLDDHMRQVSGKAQPLPAQRERHNPRKHHLFGHVGTVGTVRTSFVHVCRHE